MIRSRSLVLAFTLCLCHGPALATDEAVLEVRWNELYRTVHGRTTEIVLSDGHQVAGRVLEVRADGLTIRLARTSNPQVYPPGGASISKGTVRTLRFTSRRGPWRAIGAAIGAGVGLVAAHQVAFGAGRKSIAKTTASHLTIPPALAVTGYLVGRAVDRHVVEVRILPD